MSPRKSKGRTIQVELPPEEEFAEVPLDDVPPDFASVLQELGEDVSRLYIYRRVEGKRQAFLTTYDADAFSMDALADKYGGGTYLARLVGSDGKIFKAFQFAIDESRKPLPVAPVAPLTGGHGDLMEKVLVAVLERSLNPPPPPPPADPIAIVTALATASSKGSEAALAMLSPIMDRLARGSESKTGLAELTAAIQLGAEMGGEGKDSYLPVIREVGVPLIGALQEYLTVLKARPARVLRPAPAPVPVGKGVTTEPTATPPAAPDDPLAIIAPWVDKLVDFARNGAEPVKVAEIVRNVAPGAANWLDQVVDQPGFTAALYQRFPPLADHFVAPWVDLLLDEFGGDDDETREAKPEAPAEADDTAGGAGE